jgi:hypothetical protein
MTERELDKAIEFAVDFEDWFSLEDLQSEMNWTDGETLNVLLSLVDDDLLSISDKKDGTYLFRAAQEAPSPMMDVKTTVTTPETMEVKQVVPDPIVVEEEEPIKTKQDDKEESPDLSIDDFPKEEETMVEKQETAEYELDYDMEWRQEYIKSEFTPQEAKIVESNREKALWNSGGKTHDIWRVAYYLQAYPELRFSAKDIARNIKEITYKSATRSLHTLSHSVYIDREKIDGLFHYNITNDGALASTKQVITSGYRMENKQKRKRLLEGEDRIPATWRDPNRQWSTMDFVALFLQRNPDFLFPATEVARVLNLTSKTIYSYIAQEEERVKRKIMRRKEIPEAYQAAHAYPGCWLYFYDNRTDTDRKIYNPFQDTVKVHSNGFKHFDEEKEIPPLSNDYEKNKDDFKHTPEESVTVETSSESFEDDNSSNEVQYQESVDVESYSNEDLPSFESLKNIKNEIQILQQKKEQLLSKKRKEFEEEKERLMKEKQKLQAEIEAIQNI